MKDHKNQKDACIAYTHKSCTGIWNKFVHEMSDIYQGLKLVAEMEINNGDILMVDMKDINFFSEHLFEFIKENNNK